MKSILFGLSFALLVLEVHAQLAAPKVTWSRLLGGDQWEFLAGIEETEDDGFALRGTSYSGVSGTRTIPQAGRPSQGVPDFWRVRLDAQGNIVTEEASLFVPLLHTSDGGAVGYYQDPTLHMIPFGGSLDVALVRVNAKGEKLWSRLYGGSGDDRMTRIVELRDGSFVLAGTSSSPPGDTKTSANYGDWDYWLLWLDAQGEVMKDLTFGGSRDDFVNDFQLTADGGMILGGFSESPPDGNKTSPQYSFWTTDADFWVVKLDAAGNKQWENSYGGYGSDWLQTLRQTDDGGFILAGWTFSEASGNKASPEIGGWVVRIDGQGNKLWDRNYGTGGFTYLQAIESTLERGFVLGGTSVLSSGNMSQLRRIYVGRIDDDGNPLWEVTHLEGGQSQFVAVKQTRDRGFLIGGTSLAGPVDRLQYDFLAIKLPPDDDDGDGVPNYLDLCPGTSPASAVDENGCSISQHCPCEGPWRRHADYVTCVVTTSLAFVRAGRITKSDRSEILREAVKSDCGKR